jgi:hypothetical protein
MSKIRFGVLCTAPLCFAAIATSSSAQADTDACTVLTPAQVGAAVGIPVTDGKHVTPTYVKTCVWNVSGNSSTRFVSLYLQTAAAYDGGKQMASAMIAGRKGAAVKSVSVGDDGYYFVTGDQVGLLVKKGGASFKVAVYAKLSIEQKEAMELTLANEALAKL